MHDGDRIKVIFSEIKVSDVLVCKDPFETSLGSFKFTPQDTKSGPSVWSYRCKTAALNWLLSNAAFTMHFSQSFPMLLLVLQFYKSCRSACMVASQLQHDELFIKINTDPTSLIDPVNQNGGTMT